MMQPVMLNAEEASTAVVSIVETKLSDTAYKLEFSLEEVQNLYGYSLDFLYDSSKLELVDSDMESIVEPMGPVFSPVTLLENGLILNTVQDKPGDIDQISFAKLLKGAVAGVNLTQKTLVATVYFEVKQGQTFTGFGALTLTDTVSQVTPTKVCVKLSNPQGMKIPYTKAKDYATLDFTLSAIDLVGRNISLQNQTAQVIIRRNGTTYRTIDVTAVANNNAGYTFEVTTEANLEPQDTCYIKMAGYSSQVFTFTQVLAPNESKPIALELYSGNMNEDNVIDAQDAQLFAAAYGKTSTLADFNRDQVVNIKDLYYISKNLNR